MGDKRNYAALDWVLGEIGETLKDARQALEAYVEDPRDTARIRFCLTHIHQVHGSLQMVEFHGASLFAEEMELLTAAIMHNKVANEKEAQEVLMRSLLQLPLYLEQVKANHDDHPAIVMPLLNDLRAVRKQPYLSETNLFHPDLSSVGKVIGQRHKALDDIPKLKPVLKKLQDMYQFAAASVLRGIKIDEHLGYIDKVFARLESMTRGTLCHPTWYAASALTEALTRDDVELSVAVRGLLRHLAREIKVLNEHCPAAFDAPPQEALLRNLLYYVGLARAGGNRVAAVKQRFQLDQSSVAGGGKGGAGQSMLSAPEPEAVRAVVSALQEELNSAKFLMDRALSGQGGLSEIEETLPFIKRISDTLAVLGIADMRKHTLEQYNALVQMCKTGTVSDSVLIDVAGRLADLENRLDAIGKGRASDYTRVDERAVEIDTAKHAVLSECRNGMDVVKEAIIESMSAKWDPSYLPRAVETLNDIRGGFNMVPLPRPGAILEACSRFIQQELVNRESNPGDALQTLAEAIASVDYYLERLIGGHGDDLDGYLEMAEESLTELGYRPKGADNYSRREDSVHSADSKIAASSSESTAAPSVLSDVADYGRPATAMPSIPESGDSAGTTQSVTGESGAEQDFAGSESTEAASSAGERNDTASISETFAAQDASEPAAQSAADAEPDVGLEGEDLSTSAGTMVGAAEPDFAKDIDLAEAEAANTDAPSEEGSDDDGEGSEIDEEIVEIFVEEAAEVQETLAEYFPRWSNHLDDQNSLITVRRSFHTLKGSGRMVEAMEVGELAWAVENMLNRIMDNSVKAQSAHTDLIEKVLAVIPDLIIAFKERKPNPHKALTDQYIAWAGRLAKGEIPSELSGHAEQGVVKPDETDSDDNEDQILWDIFASEATTHLDVVRSFIDSMDAQSPLYDVPTDDLQRALHTLKGSAHMAAVTPIAAMIAPLENFVKELRIYQVRVDNDILQLIRDSVQYTQDGLECIERGEPVDLPKLDQFIARVRELRDDHVTPLIHLRDHERDGEKPVDPRLLAIFMAEEMNLLLDAHKIMADWASHPEAPHPSINPLIDELRTLSEGASQANLPAMGRLSCQLKKLHAAALENRLATDAPFFATVNPAHDTLLDMVDAVAAGQNVPTVNTELQSQLDRLVDSIESEVAEEAHGAMETAGEDHAAVDALSDVTEPETASDLDHLPEMEAVDLGLGALPQGDSVGDTVDDAQDELAPSDFEPREAQPIDSMVGEPENGVELTAPFADGEAVADEEAIAPIDDEETFIDLTIETASPPITEIGGENFFAEDHVQLAEQDEDAVEDVPLLLVDEAGEGESTVLADETLQLGPVEDSDDVIEVDVLTPSLSDDEVPPEAVRVPGEISVHEPEPSADWQDAASVDDDAVSPDSAPIAADDWLSDSEAGMDETAADEEVIDFGATDNTFAVADLESAPDLGEDEPELVEMSFGDGNDERLFLNDPEHTLERLESGELVDEEVLDQEESSSVELVADDWAGGADFDVGEAAIEDEIEIEIPADDDVIELEMPFDDAVVEHQLQLDARGVQDELHIEDDAAPIALSTDDSDDDMEFDLAELESDLRASAQSGSPGAEDDLDTIQVEDQPVEPDLNFSEEEATAEDEDTEETEEAPSAALSASAADMHAEKRMAEPALSPWQLGSPAQLAAIETDDYDQDILEIFLEEANELIEELDEAIHAWESEPDADEPAETMKRVLHTLKGGARLSGLMNLGELTHNYESFLIATRHPSDNDSFFSLVHQYQDLLLSGVKAVRDRLDGQPVADEPAPQPVPAASAETAGARSAMLRESEGQVVPFIPRPVAPKPEFVPFPEQTESAPEPQVSHPRPGSQEMVKVSADLLEELVNLAGETTISRGRLEQQVSDLTSAVDEIDTTLGRLSEQLRRLDMETEAQVLFRQERMASYEEFDPLEMDRYSQLQQLTRSLMESASDLVDLKRTLGDKLRDTETLLLQQSRITSSLQEGLMRSRMVPFSRLVPRLRRIVRQVAAELGKQVNVEFDNVEGEMDRSVLERMVAPLEHMLRNAVDHGIEMPDDRVAAGKPATGRVLVSLAREGGDILLRLADDGRGVNIKRVREKAIERGLMAEDSDLSDYDVMQFILQAGFSTAENVTQISGRGVGMDVVASEIKQLGGSVGIDSRAGVGTQFLVRLPFTVSVNRALMVQLGGETYAIPLNSIEGIVRVSPFELEHYYTQPDARFEYAGDSYQVRHLNALITPGFLPRLEGQILPLPVILVRSAQHTMALQVDGLMGSREIVVKSLGPQFAAVQGLSGATVMGDGSVVVILDVHALVRREVALLGTGRSALGVATEPEQSPQKVAKTIMVVDDSVTVRKVTTRFLEREGYNVITAKDGVDALQVLQENVPDLMLLDIEMPRMDGFEVARNVRSTSRWKQIPIIMITSRTGDKHRQHALSLGVNEYLGKPYQEEVLSKLINSLLAKHTMSA